MSSNQQKLKDDLSDVLATITNFTPSQVAEVKDLLDVGEYGIAFETLCGIVKEENKPVPPVIRPKIRSLAERMEIDPSWWLKIAEEE